MIDKYLYIIETTGTEVDSSTPMAELFEDEAQADIRMEEVKAGGVFLRKLAVKVMREE